jgi:hypothetical protein
MMMGFFLHVGLVYTRHLLHFGRPELDIQI